MATDYAYDQAARCYRGDDGSVITEEDWYNSPGQLFLREQQARAQGQQRRMIGMISGGGGSGGAFGTLTGLGVLGQQQAALGQLQQGRALQTLSNSVFTSGTTTTWSEPTPIKSKPKTIREELQAETDEWLKDVI